MVALNATVSNNISNDFICTLSACQNCCRLVEQSNQVQHHKTFQAAHPMWSSKGKGADSLSNSSSQFRVQAGSQLGTALTGSQNPAQNPVGLVLNGLCLLARREFGFCCFPAAA